jgi:hypothetical protein
MANMCLAVEVRVGNMECGFYLVGIHYLVRKDVWIKRREINLYFIHNDPDSF